ncbi:MAG: helix-turn-helix transcriptional regulator [Planctomycetes bacterium]|nr:helix-turn-helix transcriptional regulator [Planctomycetota bacterium]
MEISSLVARLRRERGLTQQDLANAIGRHMRSVARLETDGRAWSQNTALAAFRVLNRPRMTPEEAYFYLDHFGLSRGHYEAEPAPAPPPAQAPRNAGGDIAAALEAFSLLLDRHGTARATELLRALLEDPAPERILRIGPRPSPTVPGAIEETTVIERRLKSPAAIKRATKDARRQSK